MAGDAHDALSLDRVELIPAAVQPLKAAQTGAPAPDRLAMVALLVAGDPRLSVNSMEIERGGLSYTVDTLSTLSMERPAAELFWLVGADVLQSFAKWRDPERISQLATIVVFQRSGDKPDLTGVRGGKPAQVLPSRRIDISSTEIRQRVREGKSIRGFVPDAVADYIATARLYR